MKIHLIYKHFLAVLFLILGMSVTAQNFPDRSDAANRKRTAPGNCLLTAKVIKVIPARRKISKKNCKTAPCLVKLKIVKVNAYGSSFPVRYSEGQKKIMKFTCSIDDREKSRGLKKGDVIDVVVTSRPVMNSNEYEYWVSSFTFDQ